MKALIIGYGKSGKSASALLQKQGFDILVVEDDRKIETASYDRLLAGLSFVVTSPGVAEDSALVLLAKQRGIKVVGELELGAGFLQGNLIAITGTNGKTTTTSLTGKLLENKNTFVGGNIGTPISSFALQTNPNSITVAEASSFQLSQINSFKPHIAAFLNFAPDHLNYHKTTQNYLNSKLNIFKNQTQTDFAVLNYDDKVVGRIKLPASKLYYFSIKTKVNGCFVKNGSIYFMDTTKCIAGYEKAKKIAEVDDIKLLGKHNLSNALAAITCAILAGERPNIIKQKLAEFMPACHRLQKVTEFGGVEFINDSKATNPASTICAINSMTKPTILILGGSNKGIEFDKIFEIKGSLIKDYVFVGQTKQILQSCALKHDKHNYHLANTFADAVKLAYSLAEKNQVVLLSPACASYDMFSGYEERGKCFCGIVKEIEQNENNCHKNSKETKV